MKNLPVQRVILMLVLACLISGVTRIALGERSQIQVQQAQERLKNAGFDPGPIDGSLGPRTRATLRQYQAKNGLPETGELDDATLNALGTQREASKVSGAFTPTSQHPTALESIEEEAKREILNYYINMGFTKCGEDYYAYAIGANGWFIDQYKEREVFIKRRELAYADILNDIEQAFTGKFTVKAYRRYEPKTGWSDWKDVIITSDGKDVMEVNLEKRKGKWKASPLESSPLYPSNKKAKEMMKPMDCKKINRVSA